MLRTVIQALPNYVMNVFLLPKTLCVDIERMMNGFWWKGSNLDGKGIRWLSWDKLCMPKTLGGLGFKRLREFNLAMLSKQALTLIKHPHLLVSGVLKARYFPNSDFFGSTLGYSLSFIWQSIWSTKDLMAISCSFRVGDGVSISVWNDAWLYCI